MNDTNTEKRAKAVRALGLLAGSAEAQKAAILALKDEKPPVRLAAAVALGSMRAEPATGNLEEALGDSEPSVVLAAANSLLLLHDDVGYDTYYEVLTGERRASKGLAAQMACGSQNVVNHGAAPRGMGRNVLWGRSGGLLFGGHIRHSSDPSRQ